MLTATPTRHSATCSTDIQGSEGDVMSSVSIGKVTSDYWTDLPYNMKALLNVVRIPKIARDLSNLESVQIGPGVHPFCCSGKVTRA